MHNKTTWRTALQKLFKWQSLDFINNYGTEWNFDNASVLKDTLNSEQVLKASGNTDNTLSCSINSDGFINHHQILLMQ